MQRLVLIAVIILSIFFFASNVFAANRFATCDQCGYCQNYQPPSNWEACRTCLYPAASSNPTIKDTLRIPDTASESAAPTPLPGNFFTGIGCIKTNLTDFTQEGAAGSVVQLILNGIFATAGGIAFLYIIYGTYILITSQAEPERLNYAKRVIMGAVVGLIFCVSSVLIVNLIASGILQLPGFSGTTP